MPSAYDYLFAFALLSRVSDLFTTWLVTPTLKLEANALARKFRWPFAFLTLFTAFFAYWWPEIAVVLTTTSFLVAGSNAMKIPMTRALGEEAYFRLIVESAAKEKFWPGLFARLAPALFYAFLAFFIFFFFRTPDTWAFWIAYGVVTYVLAILIHWTTAYIKFRKLGKAL